MKESEYIALMNYDKLSAALEVLRGIYLSGKDKDKYYVLREGLCDLLHVEHKKIKVNEADEN